jgi:hypothetical protein
VLSDLVLSVDGHRLSLQLVSAQSASVDFLKEGMGDIRIDFDAVAPTGNGTRHLVFENHHQSGMSVYLVNGLVPTDPDIRIAAQTRNYEQSWYRLEYSQGGRAAPAAGLRGWWSDAWTAFASMVPRGVRHIAEGTDHLLFLLVLLLPAPLIAVGGRWREYGGVRHGVVRLLRIVTAFTIGHSITLALAATNVVTAPSRPVEVLIAVSILVSAIHAIRPLFPGREEFIAGGFGLVHGLAFATMIAGYGIDAWHTALTVFGFNVGIELMQLTVVGVTVPWLFLLARTKDYRLVRVGLAIASAGAAIVWIGQRALGQDNLAALAIELAIAAACGIILKTGARDSLDLEGHPTTAG